jgi:endogenous inhibitor of DNA gyrase (YacG/DUF329 family)
MKKGQRVCPTCNAPLPEKSEAFPFCSAKCKLVDLGRWLDGSYRVPGPPVETAEDDDATGRG